jgi:hypothetical protein
MHIGKSGQAPNLSWEDYGENTKDTMALLDETLELQVTAVHSIFDILNA